MQLRVTQFGEPVLEDPGKPVREFGPELEGFVRDMIETMYAEEGVGLAAQQVGARRTLFVVDLQLQGSEIDFDYRLDDRRPPPELIFPLACINPEIRETAEEQEALEEGCLSFPGIRAVIARPAFTRLRFQDSQGAWHELYAEGYLARAILHEYDHTQGVLFTKRMDRRTLRDLQPKLKKLKRTTRDWLRSRA